MTTDTRAHRFAGALRTFEESGSMDELRAQFAESPELVRPESDRATPTALDDFWDSYRSQFSEVSTEFTHVQESGDLASLEWQTRGTLAAGREISYEGVSLLTYDEQGTVSRFATYFDSAAFLPPQH